MLNGKAAVNTFELDRNIRTAARVAVAKPPVQVAADIFSLAYRQTEVVRNAAVDGLSLERRDGVRRDDQIYRAVDCVERDLASVLEPFKIGHNLAIDCRKLGGSA